MSVVSATRRGLDLAGAIERRLTAVRPAPVLAALVALQLAEALYFGFRTPHNGWIWYSGGDSTSYWTEQWALGHLELPRAVVGYALPVYYAWVPLVAGPALVNGAAVIVILQVALLVPLALVLFWLVADRLFGRVYAWAAAALWVAGPLLLLHGFVPHYHWVFDQLFLAPHWFGFTNMADLPSLVTVLACAWMTLRAFDTRSPTDAVLAGLLGGLVLAVKPSNGFFLPAVAVLLLGGRRYREAGLWTAAVVPALVTLTVWKVRGLGYLPVTSTSYGHARLAAGSSPVAFAGGHYLPLDFRHLYDELQNLREVFWSLRFLEFLAVAGLFGVIRKAPLLGAFVAVWFAGYCVVKASSTRSDFPSATFFRLAEPGLPAYILLIVGVAFCLPRLGRRTTTAAPVAAARASGLDARILAPAAAVLAVVPLALVLAARPSSRMNIVRDENTVQEAPLSQTFDLRATRDPGGAVTLTWRKPPTGSTQPWFVVYTSPDSDGCSPPDRGALECLLNMPVLTVTQSRTVVDHPGTAQHFYRVALLAQYQRDVQGGDLMLVSDGVHVPQA
ncbi:MAG TPA: hypothetical protein VFA19_05485 [Gaiellaceae bacterium]|nr:hypothetical protein [Gaiellaceae bacterium]